MRKKDLTPNMRFLAKYGSEEHIDNLMNHKNDNNFPVTDVLDNQNLKPHHLENLYDSPYYKRSVVSHPKASHDLLDKHIENSKDLRHDLGPLSVRNDLRHDHIDKILMKGSSGAKFNVAKNSPNLLDRHYRILTQEKEFDINYALARNEHTPDHWLHHLSTNEDMDVREEAHENLKRRGLK